MSSQTFQVVAVVFGALAYLLATCTLRTLAAHVRLKIERHDLLIATKKKRIEYLQSVADRKGMGGEE